MSKWKKVAFLVTVQLTSLVADSQGNQIAEDLSYPFTDPQISSLGVTVLSHGGTPETVHPSQPSPSDATAVPVYPRDETVSSDQSDDSEDCDSEDSEAPSSSITPSPTSTRLSSGSLLGAIETPIYDDFVIDTIDGAEDAMSKLASIRSQAISAALAQSTLTSQLSMSVSSTLPAGT